MKKASLPLAWPYVTIIILITAGIIFATENDAIGPRDLAGYLFPLFGTFLGALFAFRLQERREAALKIRARIDAINRALLILALQYNYIVPLARELKLYKNEQERLVNLPAIRPPEYFDDRQKAEELVFLAFAGSPDIVMDVAVEQGRFDACIEVLRGRAQLLVAEVQPLIEAKNLNRTIVSGNELLAAFGERIYGSLETATNDVYQHVMSTEQSLIAVANRLHAIAKSLYPKETFLKLGGVRPEYQATIRS